MKRGITMLLLFAVWHTVAAAATLSLTFNHTFSGKPLELGPAKYVTAAKESVSISRLSYLLSGFALERSDGSWLELERLPAWNDLERGRGKVDFLNVPPGAYRSIRFAVGLSPEDNVREVVDYPPDHPLNPNLNGLHWTWQTGYIFLALEGHVEETKGFSYHLARSSNLTWVNLAINFDGTGSKVLVVDVDVEALLNAPYAISIARDGVSTHSREGDPLVPKLKANLASAMQARQMIDLSPAALVRTPKPPLYLPSTHVPVSLYFSRRLPLPALPEDNPLFEERIALGAALFRDGRLSRNNEMSCASCHRRQHALTDPRRFSVGIDGTVGTRNAMPLFNLAWKNHFFWDGRAATLREQALIPIEDPTEMAERLGRVVEKLKRDPQTVQHFAAAFDPPEITPEKIGLAIEQFLITRISWQSKYDRAKQGKVKLTVQEQRGFHLFMTEYEPRSGQYGADCFHCHGGTLFSDHQFHNNGLLPTDDRGRFSVTGSESDQFKFVTPSLRNIAVTAPYMHDGRFQTLKEVIAHYNHGLHRSPTLDPNLAKHPPAGLGLSAEDQQALIAFLNTLTDQRFLEEEH